MALISRAYIWELRRKQRELEAELEKKRQISEAKAAMRTHRFGHEVQPVIKKVPYPRLGRVSASPSVPPRPERTRCQSCGFWNPILNDYCGKCGVTLNSGSLICPNCLESNSSSANFCRKCGQHLEEDETRIY